MKSKSKNSTILRGMLLLMSQNTQADTIVSPTAALAPTVSTVAGVPINSIAATNHPIKETLQEKLALTYFGVYRGASLSDLGNSLQPDTNGQLDPTSPQSLENIITAGYRISKDSMIGINTHFYYFPIGHPAGAGQSLQMWDPSVVLSKSGLVDQGGFKLNAKLTVQLPITSVDILQTHHFAATIQPALIGNYDIPKTNLSIGFFSFITAYIPTNKTPENSRTYKIYLAPTANYQLSKTLAATLWVDLFQVTRNQGTGFFSGMSNYTVDIEPGISWDITKNISINPMINFYPATPTLAATSLQAIIIAKAF